jgi:flavin-dependent dehydrogenase
VRRLDFDHMLLENAAAKGAEVYEEVRVHEVLFEDDTAVGIRAEFKDGAKRDIAAKVVVDATGQSALLAKKFKLRRTDPNLKHCAFFTRFKGARRDPGIDEGATLIMHTESERSWFWYIPQPDDVVSVGVVGSLDYLVKGRSNDPAVVFQEEVERCEPLRERIAGAEQEHEIRVLKDFSYASTRIAGNGWVLAGDAFGFIDPIYSSGVFLALKGGEMAADSILEAFAADDFSAARLGKHGSELVAGVDALRKLVYAYYDPDFSIGEFIKRFPEQEENLVHLLIGNVYRKDVSGLLRAMDEYRELPEYEPIQVEEAAV